MLLKSVKRIATSRAIVPASEFGTYGEVKVYELF